MASTPELRVASVRSTPFAACQPQCGAAKEVGKEIRAARLNPEPGKITLLTNAGNDYPRLGGVARGSMLRVSGF